MVRDSKVAGGYYTSCRLPDQNERCTGCTVCCCRSLLRGRRTALTSMNAACPSHTICAARIPGCSFLVVAHYLEPIFWTISKAFVTC